MEDLQTRGMCIVFHAYENGKKTESWDFFDNLLEADEINVVQEDTLDLTKYEEVHIRQENDGNVYYGFNEGVELPDDYRFDVIIHHVILPNKESWDLIELVDENIDYETWQPFSGEDFIDYIKVTAEGQENIDDEKTIEEDDMW